MSQVLLWAALAIPITAAQTGGFAVKAALAADQIRRGNPAERSQGIRTVSGDPALLMDEDIRAAVGEELARIADGIRSGRTPAKPEAGSRSDDREREYWHEVVDLALRMNDARFVDPLLWFVGTSAPVSTWIATFGDQIVPAIVARYDDACFASGSCPELLKFGLLGTAAKAFSSTRAAGAQRAILDLAVKALQDISNWQALMGGISIASESCDAELLAVLEPLAAADSRLGVSGKWQARVRGEAAAALGACRRR